MEATTFVFICVFVLLTVILLFVLGLMLAIGAVSTDLDAFKKGVRNMAGAADSGFLSDRKRLAHVEQFLVVAFKLDELFNRAKSDTPSLSSQVGDPKKTEYKN